MGAAPAFVLAAPAMGLLSMLARRARGNRSMDEDLNVEEEIARNLWANHKMLPPESAFKKYWNMLIVLLVMYNTLFIVLVVCYNRFDAGTGLYGVRLLAEPASHALLAPLRPSFRPGAIKRIARP